MSMSTIRGACCGKIRTASSPLEQAQTQRQVEDRLRIFSRPSRVVLLSSTMATLIMRMAVQVQAKLDGRALACRSGDLAIATEIVKPFAHSRQAIAARRCRCRTQ